MKTQLKTKDIPHIIGLSSKGLGLLMEAMSMEYCLWWCGQVNKLDAQLLNANAEFKDWWLEAWIRQDHRFLTYATAKMAQNGQIGSKSMMQTYLTYHRSANEEVKADGELVMWKTMLPEFVQRSWMAEIKNMNLKVSVLINSISNN